MGVIYCIHCLKTNKKYIGSSVCLVKRISKHYRLGERQEGGSQLLYEDIYLYGRESFLYGIVEEVDESILRDREDYWKRKLHETYTLYNMKNPVEDQEERKRKHRKRTQDNYYKDIEKSREKGRKKHKKNYSFTEELKRKKKEYYEKNKERINEKRRKKT